METNIRRHTWLNLLSLFLVLPATWFICINMLNEVGIRGLYNSSQPALESMGIKESLGWNINLLILFGPVIALLLSALQVLHMEWHSSKEQFQFSITIRRKWFPLFITFLSGLMLVALFIYLAVENLVIR